MYINSKFRAAKDAVGRTTRAGKPLTNAFGFLDISGPEGLVTGLTAFGPLSEELLKVKKGDVIFIAGEFSANDYTNSMGEAIKGYTVKLDMIVSARTTGAKFNQPDITPQEQPMGMIQKSHSEQSDQTRYY